MTGITRLTILDTIPVTTVSAGGDTVDTQIKAAGYNAGLTALVGIYIGGTAGNLVYENFLGNTRTLPVIANQVVQLRCKRILTSTATDMFLLIGDM